MVIKGWTLDNMGDLILYNTENSEIWNWNSISGIALPTTTFSASPTTTPTYPTNLPTITPTNIPSTTRIQGEKIGKEKWYWSDNNKDNNNGSGWKKLKKLLYDNETLTNDIKRKMNMLSSWILYF